MQPLNVVVVNPDGADTPAGLTQAQDLETKLAALPHVATIRSFLGSLPDKKTLNVADQLATVKKSVDDGATASTSTLHSGSGRRPATAAPCRRRFRQPPGRRLPVEGRRRLPGADRPGLPRRHPEQRLRTGHRRALAVGRRSASSSRPSLDSSGDHQRRPGGDRAGLGPAQGHLPRARHAAGVFRHPAARRDPSSRPLPAEQLRLEGAPRRLPLRRRHRRPAPGGARLGSLQP